MKDELIIKTCTSCIHVKYIGKVCEKETQFSNEGTLPFLCPIEELVSCVGDISSPQMPFLALCVLKKIIPFEEYVSSRNLGTDMVSVV